MAATVAYNEGVIASFAAALALASAQQDTVQLKRVFVPGTKSAYSVAASLHLEIRAGSLQTFLPHDVDLSYPFTMQVLGVSAGIGTIRYERPTFTTAEAENGDEQPKKDVEELNQVALLKVSPVNEIIDDKDISKKKKRKEKDSGGDEEVMISLPMPARKGQDPITYFMQDIERLCVFIGSLDTSMDLAPKFDLNPVKVGSTWKRTVGFQPQKMKNEKDKMEVQRLDITYAYAGTGTYKGKPVQIVTAELQLDTDLGKYLNDLIGEPAEITKIKSINLKLHSKLKFELDPKTNQTLHGVCDSEGGFSVMTTESENAVVEQKIKGNTVMTLVSNKVVAPAKKS